MADEIVGSLSFDRLRQMLALADEAHPELRPSVHALERATGPLGLPSRYTSFLGTRATAESGETWTVNTVAASLMEVSAAVEEVGLGEQHFVTVQNVEPSVAQSALTELALERGWATERPDGLVEWVQFGKLDAGWVGSVLERVKALFKRRVSEPGLPDAPDAIPNELRMVLVGDWGTNLYGARAFSEWAKTKGPFDAVIHLGDTYYSGTLSEVTKRLQGPWPIPEGSKTISRFLNGNHEMYCGGKPYFRFIQSFGQASRQRSSVFTLQNDHWLIIGLDTSWHGFKVEPMMHSGHLAVNQRKWLVDVVRNAGGRNVILLSHHQPFHFDGTENPELTTELEPVWETGNVRFWFWGHQHAGVRYDAVAKFGFEGRCVGHSGMPEVRPKKVRESQDRRPIPGTPYSWQGLTTRVNRQELHAWIIDGPNRLVSNDPDFAPNGWVEVRLSGASLEEHWYIADGGLEVSLP